MSSLQDFFSQPNEDDLPEESSLGSAFSNLEEPESNPTMGLAEAFSSNASGMSFDDLLVQAKREVEEEMASEPVSVDSEDSDMDMEEIERMLEPLVEDARKFLDSTSSSAPSARDAQKEEAEGNLITSGNTGAAYALTRLGGGNPLLASVNAALYPAHEAGSKIINSDPRLKEMQNREYDEIRDGIPIEGAGVDVGRIPYEFNKALRPTAYGLVEGARGAGDAIRAKVNNLGTPEPEEFRQDSNMRADYYSQDSKSTAPMGIGKQMIKPNI